MNTKCIRKDKNISIYKYMFCNYVEDNEFIYKTHITEVYKPLNVCITSWFEENPPLSEKDIPFFL